MIPIQQATQTVLNHTRDFGTEKVSFTESLGRVLQEDLCAD